MPRRLTALALVALAGALALAAPPALAQSGRGAAARVEPGPELWQLKARAERVFQIVETRRGLILVPRSESSRARTIELNDGQVFVDASPVTGRELRDRVGSDADVIVQLSFLDAAARRALFGSEPAATPAPAVPPTSPEAPPSAAPPSVAPGEGWSETARYRHGGARVRFGGDVTVAEDEAVGDDVVVIIGSAHIQGRVDGAVVAVGGSVRLGPKAVVRGDVTAVGGGVERATGAVVAGEINEVRFSSPAFVPMVGVRPWRDWNRFGGPFGNPFGPSISLVATLIRMGVIGLFAALSVAILPGPVRRVADRVAGEPWRAGLVGLAAQLLFVPLLVLTVVILAVSIIGIPLLLLVPFGLVVVLVAFLIGFAGTGCALGQLISRRSSGSVPTLLASLAVGLAVVWGLTVCARFAGLAGPSVRVILSVVLLVGFLVEYLAWTVGLGAVLLSRFGRRDGRVGVPAIPL
jgi:hypothetical protein